MVPTDNLSTPLFQYKDPSHVHPFKQIPTSKNQNRTLYEDCLMVALPAVPSITGKCIWTEQEVVWDAAYETPSDSRDGDISWRLLHNRLVTPALLYKWRRREENRCPWCPLLGSALHMMFQCPAVQEVWTAVINKINSVLGQRAANLPVLLCGYPGRSKSTALANFIVTLTKSTIYRTYIHYLRCNIEQAPNYLAIVKSRLQYKILLSLHYHKLKQSQSILKEDMLLS